MFNTRDEEIDLSEIYNPYRPGKNVENRVTGSVAKIVDIRGYIVILQLDIDKNFGSKDFMEIEYDELRRNWKKCEKIIIGKLPPKEEWIHIGLPHDNIEFEVSSNGIVVSKNKIKTRRKHL